MNIATSFVFVRMPELHFGAGKIAELPQLIAQRGRRILLVTGSASFLRSPQHDELVAALGEAGIETHRVVVRGEPSPDFVDEVAAEYRDMKIDCVVAIGGGSAVDAGKAISAMLLQEGSVACYLEGRETKKHDGRKVPFIAVPTSSGTGAEATKNAVLSDVGAAGFKSSLRHDAFVADLALIDPELMRSCPPNVTAACGLDALTQLLESYVSSKASPVTDALAVDGLAHIAEGFLRAVENGESDMEARSHMAYAAFLSGVTLANAGLGVVHGFAGPIGGYFPMPHGEVCGTLVGAATRANVEVILAAPAKYPAALKKYARAGAVLSRRPASMPEADCRALVATLDEWIERTAIPRLGAYGVARSDFAKILDKSNNKNSPVALNREQMEAILEARL
jgi:alcohol dehydrogenase class IV